MGWDKIRESECSVAKSLAVIGDRWTILLIRDLLGGRQRFDRLQANTQVSPHLLSTRLKRLEDEGVVERVPYQERPPRFEYQLTPKGRGLYPVLVSLSEWGKRWCGCDSGADAKDAAEEPNSLPAEKATADS
jgi:DNA-binding HxlR family transcriptional regulator